MTLSEDNRAKVSQLTFLIAPHLAITNPEDATCPNCGDSHDICAVPGCDNNTICYSIEGRQRDPFLFCGRCTNLMDAAEYIHGQSFKRTPRLRHMLDVILGAAETFEDPHSWQRTPWNED